MKNHLDSTNTTKTLYSLSPDKKTILSYPPNADTVILFAVSELQKYLKKISGITVTVTFLKEVTVTRSIFLYEENCFPPEFKGIAQSSFALREDGFRLYASQGGIIMAGSTSRGALYAVYALLESLGCRFYSPGEQGEVIPHHKTLLYPRLDITQEPAFRRRDITEDFRYALQDDGTPHPHHINYWKDFLDWMGKNRINSTRNLPDPLLLKEEAEKRGITSWGGGHILRNLLPRDLFPEHPDYFRMDASGQRTLDGNICASSEEGLRVIAKNAIDFIEKNSQIENLNVWGEDIWGGSWCYCPECSSLPPQDQYMITCNAIARGIKKAGKKIPVVYIAYQDTLMPDISIKPEPNLRLHWAPRQRAYGKFLGDHSSELNQWHTKLLREWIKIFGADRIDIFEYYGDSLLSWNVPLPLPHVIADDLKYYHSHGISDRILLLKLGDSIWHTNPLNAYTFARISYDLNQNVDSLIDDYFMTKYQDSGQGAQRWFTIFETAMALTSQWGDILWVPSIPAFLMDKFNQDVTQCLASLREAKKILDDANQKIKIDSKRKKIEELLWTNDFAIRQVSGLQYHVRGALLYGRAQLIKGLVKCPSFPLKIGLPPVYSETRKMLGKAKEIYEETLCYVQSTEIAQTSLWLKSNRMGFPRLQRLVIEYLTQLIQECE